jgi:hypothetical protein
MEPEIVEVLRMHTEILARLTDRLDKLESLFAAAMPEPIAPK